MGEPYIFVCQGGFLNIAAALLYKGRTDGCFIAGPMAIGSVRDSNLLKYLASDRIPPELYPKVILFINQMKKHSPKEVSHLALLLQSCVLSSIESAEDYIKAKKQYEEKNSLDLLLHSTRKNSQEPNYPYDLERKLVEAVRAGDAAGSQEVLRKLIDELYVLESGDLAAIKAKIFGVMAVLSREIPEWGKNHEEVWFEGQELYALYEEENPKRLIQQAATLAALLAEHFLDQSYSGSRELIAKTVRYVNRHYQNKLTLNEIAESLHVNPAYLSTLFRQEMGIRFSEYLCAKRIREARHLLAESNYSMTEIALRCGFEDQSYFTRQFKKSEGATPTRYRRESRSR